MKYLITTNYLSNYHTTNRWLDTQLMIWNQIIHRFWNIWLHHVVVIHVYYTCTCRLICPGFVMKYYMSWWTIKLCECTTNMILSFSCIEMFINNRNEFTERNDHNNVGLFLTSSRKPRQKRDLLIEYMIIIYNI